MKIYISVLKLKVRHNLTQDIFFVFSPEKNQLQWREFSLKYLITLRAKQEQNLQDSNIQEPMPMLQYKNQCLCCYTRSNNHAAIQGLKTMLLYKNQCLRCYKRTYVHVAIHEPMSILVSMKQYLRCYTRTNVYVAIQ